MDTHGRPGGVIGKKIFEHFFPNNFFLVFYHGKAGPSASLLYSKTREFIYMLRMDGQTAGPIGLNFFLRTLMGGRGIFFSTFFSRLF